ncbi:hypothetical protein GW17_00024478 [Ensete ventricosum]|nr:hypothetical protein GW17_00024478 [Ensete ventricosum]
MGSWELLSCQFQHHLLSLSDCINVDTDGGVITASTTKMVTGLTRSWGRHSSCCVSSSTTSCRAALSLLCIYVNVGIVVER